MIGRRIECPYAADGGLIGEWPKPGDYWFNPRIGWCAETPGSVDYGAANLSKHTVIEHEDGTITVSPSILVMAGHKEEWHGFLERGVWRQA
jgi:hypothetical protein